MRETEESECKMVREGSEGEQVGKVGGGVESVGEGTVDKNRIGMGEWRGKWQGSR